MAFGHGGVRHRVAGMSPHIGVGQGPTGVAFGAPLACFFSSFYLAPELLRLTGGPLGSEFTSLHRSS